MCVDVDLPLFPSERAYALGAAASVIIPMRAKKGERIVVSNRGQVEVRFLSSVTDESAVVAVAVLGDTDGAVEYVLPDDVLAVRFVGGTNGASGYAWPKYFARGPEMCGPIKR